MVGSSVGDRSKEAVKVMALHDALRSVCLNSDWIYSVFWTIRPRPRVRGGNGCKHGDDIGSLMLMWEDGFCNTTKRECFSEMDEDDLVKKAFRKMSIQLYNYGEGLMGKVASDKCHKWIFKEPAQCEQQPNISNYWHSSFDALPTEWTEQFQCGIQTIAVIQAGHGLLQLGSCKVIPEDLHFVLRMRQIFESLGYQSGFYFSQLFSSATPMTAMPYQLRPVPAMAHNLPMAKEEPQMLILPGASSDDHLMAEQDDVVIKWPKGLSLYDVIAGRTDETKLFVDPNRSISHPNEMVNLDSNSSIDRKFKRCFTLPARIPTSSTSNSLQLGDCTGMYSGAMETSLD